MPSLQQLDLDIDLRSDPLAYPGPVASRSSLLIDDTVLPVRPRHDRRLGHAAVLIDERVNGLGKEFKRSVPLNYVLLVRNEAPVDARLPVLAVGSNASPGQLHRKLVEAAVSSVVPMIKAKASGLRIGHSAHVSEPGYVPAAPMVDPNHSSDELFVLLLDRSQADAIDNSEPNYGRIAIPNSIQIVLGGSDELLRGVSVYASNHGLLAEVGTGPIPLSAQGEVIEHILNSSPEVRRLVGTSTTDFIEACAGSSHLRECVRDILADLGYVADDGFNSRDSIDISYGSAESGLKAPVGRDDWLTVRGSPDDLDRRGEPCVVVATSLAGTLGGHALVIPGGSEEPGLVARVVHQSDIPRGVVLADQAVRNATGVEVGEYIRLRPASIATSRIADMLVSSRRYITARVQGADLAIVEQDSCLMDRLAMQMIGIESGDVVVIEGVNSEAATPVPSIRIKAYECDEAIQDRRKRLQGGGFESRFPSSRDALSVYPDLPWVYLDRAARTTLGLSGQKLGAVRIRASRRNQVGKEAREIVLLVTLAVIGIIAVSESPLIRVLFVIALAVAIIAVLILRLRYRLGLAKVRILDRPRR